MKSTVYAGAANWAAADSRDHLFGLFRLKSGSEDWENITNGGLPEKCEIRAIVVDPKNTDRVYVGTQVGPYVSEDGGDNWTPLTLPSDNAVTWS
ncbi:MAG: hypothetical protein VXX79_04255, partial [Pseudomonadota bacterium]|nr:hypothetical protein [Pseudomonadota bacterium]